MNDKLIFRIIAAVSIFVFCVVVLLNKKVLPVPNEIPDFVYKLPKFNAIINGTCTCLLLLSLYFIKQKNVTLHKKIVRWSYPIWLYVTITGVVVYLMLSPYYTH